MVPNNHRGSSLMPGSRRRAVVWTLEVMVASVAVAVLVLVYRE